MKKLVHFLLPLLIVISCGKGTETVTVKTDPSQLFTSPDSVLEETVSEDDFIHIKLGEIAAIESLDPLFATSNSEFRMAHLLYEGLTGIDETGSVIPELAKRWEVNNDSTQFIFHLQPQVYFQDSPVFNSGSGRHFAAPDVKYVFERMASSGVPAFAANNFQYIHGFKAYLNEQIYVKDPAKRVYDSIEGITLRNDSTIIFNMEKPAPGFLKKLAHPIASIYPRESVTSANQPIQQAAGTGRFTFIKKENNTYLLTGNKNHRDFTPKISRLDIISGLPEKDMFQEFAKENLDILVEPGASTLLTITDADGNLMENVYHNYQLQKTSVLSNYPIYFNTKSGQAAQAQEFISAIETDSLLERAFLGSISLQNIDTTLSTSQVKRQLVITHTTHPFELFLLNILATRAAEVNISFSMNASYAPSDYITFTTLAYPDTELFLSWKSPVYILSHSHITGIAIKQKPWNISFDTFKTTGGN